MCSKLLGNHLLVTESAQNSEHSKNLQLTEVENHQVAPVKSPEQFLDFRVRQIAQHAVFQLPQSEHGQNMLFSSGHSTTPTSPQTLTPMATPRSPTTRTSMWTTTWLLNLVNSPESFFDVLIYDLRCVSHLISLMRELAYLHRGLCRLPLVVKVMRVWRVHSTPWSRRTSRAESGWTTRMPRRPFRRNGTVF